MRASWSLMAVAGMALPLAVAASEDTNLTQAHVRTAVVISPPAHHDHDHGDRHEHGGFRHFRGPFVYVTPYTNYTTSDDQAADNEPPLVRTEYVPVPYPVPVAPEAPPAPQRPPLIVRYATSGQHIDIPKGAHVTSGSVYKYKQGGVNVYTNVPPPDSARATMLFDYTEAVAPAPSPQL